MAIYTGPLSGLARDGVWSVSGLQFTNDTLIFYETFVYEAENLRFLLTYFRRASGLKLNYVMIKIFYLGHDRERAARGKAIVNLLNLEEGEKISAFLPVREFQEGRFVVFSTKRGAVKKTELMAYSNPRSNGIRAIGLEAGDEVIGVRLTDGQQEVLLSTLNGQSIRFKEGQVRPTGRGTFGVSGISLEKEDRVVSMEMLSQGASLLTVAENGYGKRTAMEEYRLQSRGGKGIITMKTTEKTGRVIGVHQVTDDDQLMMVANKGKIIRLRVKDISTIGRNTQGVRLIEMEDGERVVAVARLAEKEDEEEGQEQED